MNTSRAVRGKREKRIHAGQVSLFFKRGARKKQPLSADSEEERKGEGRNKPSDFFYRGRKKQLRIQKKEKDFHWEKKRKRMLYGTKERRKLCGPIVEKRNQMERF